MRDVVRTMLLAAVGGIELTEARLRSVLEELVKRGELAVEEARTLAAEVAERSERRRAGADGRIDAAVDEALGRLNVASHTSVAELQARVAALEQAIAGLTAPAGRT